MGLMDILNGMQNGPRGQSQPVPAGGSQGMSPVVTAMLALIAYKAIKGGGLGNMLGGGQPSGQNPGSDTSAASSGGLGGLFGGLLGGRSTGVPGGTPGGGMGDLLGGLLGGGVAGSVLTSGLGNLLKDFQNSGSGQVAQSWIGTGRNEEIAPDALEKAIGGDTLNALMAQSGLSRGELLEGLNAHLPNFVDKLTPQGRLPTEQEAARL